MKEGITINFHSRIRLPSHSAMISSTGQKTGTNCIRKVSLVKAIQANLSKLRIIRSRLTRCSTLPLVRSRKYRKITINLRICLSNSRDHRQFANLELSYLIKKTAKMTRKVKWNKMLRSKGKYRRQ